MIDGRLYINSHMVGRERIGLKRIEENGQTITVVEYQETLPEGLTYHIYEASDNGPLDNTREYIVPESHYFMLGDNRDNSMDSRVMDRVGFVPFSNITGRGQWIFLRDNKMVWLSLE